MQTTIILAHGGMMTADEIAMFGVGVGFFFGLPILALLFVLAKRRRDVVPDGPEQDGDLSSSPPDQVAMTDEPKADAFAGRHDIDRGWR